MPDIKVEAIMSAMAHDKKVREGKLRFVLLKSIGDVVVTDEVAPSVVEQVLAGDD